mgnify:CR=1 FL=1
MKILLVNKYFNMHGGSETYFFGLADLLRQAGHEVIFFAMQDEKNLPCEQSAYFVSNVEFNGELTAAQKLKAAFRMVYSFEAKKKMHPKPAINSTNIPAAPLIHSIRFINWYPFCKKSLYRYFLQKCKIYTFL